MRTAPCSCSGMSREASTRRYTGGLNVTLGPLRDLAAEEHIALLAGLQGLPRGEVQGPARADIADWQRSFLHAGIVASCWNCRIEAQRLESCGGRVASVLGSCAPEIDQEIEPLNGLPVSAQQGQRAKSRQRSGGPACPRRGKRALRRIWYANGRKESVFDSDARSQVNLIA